MASWSTRNRFPGHQRWSYGNVVPPRYLAVVPLPLEPSFENPAEQADADARHVWGLALGLGNDASPERTAAVVSLLLEHVNADAARLDVAAAVCRAHHRPGDDDGYRRAGQLIELAQQRIAAAGASSDPVARERLLSDLQAQWHSVPQAFEWDRERRRRVRWWLRYLSACRARFRHEPARSPAGIQRVYIALGKRPIGQMKYQVCDECSLVLVGKIDITFDYQGLDLGTRAVERVYARHPGHAWHTTPQYPTSGTFWSRMARRTGAAFTKASPCMHMKRDLPRG